MLGAIVAVLAGWSIKRLWPHGVLFLLLWPAFAVVVQMPSKKEALERLGEHLELTPTVYLKAYFLTALVSGLFFFAAFGVKKLAKRQKANRAPNQ